MKSFISHIYITLASLLLMACQSENMQAITPEEVGTMSGKTLVVYYSYTNNTKEIVSDLCKQIEADVLEILPAEKGLDYAANNYRIGTEQLSKIKAAPDDESSYPAIDPVSVDLTKYENIIIATPLWWSQMASNMQTFLFQYGKEMSGKNIGLIVSSYSSGISGVEADCKRLIPDGKHLKSLWINNSNHSRRASLIEEWLQNINYQLLMTQNSSSYMYITINGKTVSCNLVDNSSAKTLAESLFNNAITYEADDYGNFEKVGDLGITLPQNDEPISTVPGDVILYQGSKICLYYDKNSWTFTRLGKIEDLSQDALKEFLAVGEGPVHVTLSLSAPQSGVGKIASESSQSSRFQGLYAINGMPLNEVPEKGFYIEDGVKKLR